MGFDDSFDLNRQSVEAVQGLADVMAKMLVSATLLSKKYDEIITKAKKGADDVNKKTKTIASSAENVSRAFSFDKIVLQAEKVSQVFTESAKKVQASTSTTLREYSSFINTLTTNTRELNKTLGSSKFNTKELLAAANTLASIGWKDLGSISEMSGVLASMTKALGSVSSAFASSIFGLQRVFEDGTDELVESMGDSFTTFNKLFGVNIEKLQGVSAKMSSSLTRISDKTLSSMKALTQDVMRAASLTETIGIDSTSIANILDDAMNMSLGTFSQKYGSALSIAGVNMAEFQQSVQSGNSFDAVTSLLEGISDRMASSDMNTQNLYREMLSSLNLTNDDINAIINNSDKIPDIVREVAGISVDAGAMREQNKEMFSSLGERLAAGISSSPVLGSILSGLTNSGMNLQDVSSAVNIFRTAGKGLEALMKSSASVGSVLGKFSGLMFGVYAAFEVLQRVFNDEDLQEVFQEKFGELVTVITDIIDTLAPILSQLFDDLAEVVKPIVMSLLDVFVTVKPLIEAVLNGITAMAPIVRNMLMPFIELFKKNMVKMQQMTAKIMPVITFISNLFSAIIGGFQAVGNWLADISLFGWHPFEFMRSSGGASSAPEIPAVTEDKMAEVTNSTSSSEFKSTAAGGLTYGFGMTGNGFHVGTDIPMSSGTPISMAQAGLVSSVGSNSVYGNYAAVSGLDGIQRVFGHLSSSSVSPGQFILPGQQIGTSGDTGNSVIPHLHYETRQDGRFVDPLLVAKNKSGNADVVQAIKIMTERLENKLEEVSQQTDSNTKWIEEFDLKQRLRFTEV